MGNNSSSSLSNDTMDRSHGGSHRRDTNQSSQSNGAMAHIGILRRGHTGLLGLSRSELDKMCKPSGLYPTCSWDDRSIRRLIGDGKLAPRLSGHETILSSSDVECPICFLNYLKVNETSCCKGHICTECYLQLRPMHDNNAACPFCNTSPYSVKISDIKPVKTIDDDEIDGKDILPDSPKIAQPKDGEFGSRLLRVRSESLTSSELSEDLCPATTLTLSAKERERIEQQMKEQYNHPLARRIEMEAEERRHEHDQRYRRANSDPISTNRGLLARNFLHGRLHSRGRHSRALNGLSAESGDGSRRNWNQIVRSFEQSYGSEGRVQTLDDLVVLEAAILLSMEQQAARRRNRREGNEDGDATENPREGFPEVLQALMSRRVAESSRTGDEDTDEEEESNLSTLRIQRPRPGRRNWMSTLLNSEAGATANLLMRGVSEEEQLEMAIAASLRDVQQSQGNEVDNGEDNSNHAGEQSTDTNSDPNVNSASSAGTIA